MKRLALTSAACALLLSACSGGSDDTATSDTNAAAETQPSSTQSATLQETNEPAPASTGTHAEQIAEARANVTNLRTEIDGLDAQIRERISDYHAATARLNTLMIEPARQCVMPEGTTIPRDTAPEGGNADGAANALAAVNYLDSIMSEPCMFQLPSGLILRIREASEDGASPITGDYVTVHYRGTLSYGVEFDSSLGGEPATFPSDRLIRGWVEALPLMRVGETWELYIHPDLAYGANPRPGGAIGPNQALVFEMELIDLPG
jgi:FKBP-type peptidyl-prolyl cis-trans isomerase FklB